MTPARDRLLALLEGSNAVKQGWAKHLADELLPVVEQIAADRAAPEDDDLALAWHDEVCPEGDRCRARKLHALSEPVYAFGLLRRFLNRLTPAAALRSQP